MAQVNSLPSLEIPNKFMKMMQEYAESQLPNEACGILAGKNFSVKAVFCIENSLHSPVRFKMKPEQQLEAFQKMEKEGWELSAIFHSHPNGPDSPSETDVREAYYPESAYLIWFRSDAIWKCSSYQIRDGKVKKTKIILQP